MQDNMSRQDDPDDYVVHDPLLEKGKEKFNRMQAKLKRREREWAGKSLTWFIFADLCEPFFVNIKDLSKTDELVRMPICLGHLFNS